MDSLRPLSCKRVGAMSLRASVNLWSGSYSDNRFINDAHEESPLRARLYHRPRFCLNRSTPPSLSRRIGGPLSKVSLATSTTASVSALRFSAAIWDSDLPSSIVSAMVWATASSWAESNDSKPAKDSAMSDARYSSCVMVFCTSGSSENAFSNRALMAASRAAGSLMNCLNRFNVFWVSGENLPLGYFDPFFSLACSNNFSTLAVIVSASCCSCNVSTCDCTSGSTVASLSMDVTVLIFSRSFAWFSLVNPASVISFFSAA